VNISRATSIAFALAAFLTIVSPNALRAQGAVGTWVKQSGRMGAGAMSMTVEACCNGGRRLIYHVAGSDMVLTVESPLDGSDVPVMIAGKPSGQTMGIKRVDDHHTVTVLKINGKPYGTSKAALSADGTLLTIESEYTSTIGGQAIGKITETWVRK
jgi:hypothetical protein